MKENLFFVILFIIALMSVCLEGKVKKNKLFIVYLIKKHYLCI